MEQFSYEKRFTAKLIFMWINFRGLTDFSANLRKFTSTKFVSFLYSWKYIHASLLSKFLFSTVLVLKIIILLFNTELANTDSVTTSSLILQRFIFPCYYHSRHKYSISGNLENDSIQNYDYFYINKDIREIFKSALVYLQVVFSPTVFQNRIPKLI